MATGEKKIYRDGQLEFLGGGDSGRHPILLEQNQVSNAINHTFRGGRCKKRPPFQQKWLKFADSEHYDWFKTGRVQGWGEYSYGGRSQLIVSISGRIFSIEPYDWSVTERTPVGSVGLVEGFTVPAVGSTVEVQVSSIFDLYVGYPVYIDTYEYTVTIRGEQRLTLHNVSDTRVGTIVSSGGTIKFLSANTSYSEQAWMEQVDKYFVIQNGQNSAIIFDGPKNRRAEADHGEVPTGRQMAFGMGRLWVAVSDNEVVAGDILGGETSVLQFTENTYINEGGKFKIPNNAGPIRAMKFATMLDTSLGNGPLLVFSERGIFSLNAPVDRDTWKDLKTPIQTYSMVGYGAESHYSVVDVNADKFYRAKDGWRSFILATRDFNTWGNIPISSEIDTILKEDDARLLKHSSAIVFDNRIIFTVNPSPLGEGAYFRGMCSLDFNPISTLGAKGKPAYDMLWNGINPSGLLKATIDGSERAFAFVVNESKHVELWEILKSGSFDNEDGRIQSALELKALMFGNPYELKRLKRGELYFSDVQGDVDVVVYYKPDDYPCWITWHSFSLCQQYRTQDAEAKADNDISVKHPGFRTRIKLPEPDNTELPSDGKLAKVFYTLQIRIDIIGAASLSRYIAVAEQTTEDVGYPV
jgi:hypothetical protein